MAGVSAYSCFRSCRNTRKPLFCDFRRGASSWLAAGNGAFLCAGRHHVATEKRNRPLRGVGARPDGLQHSSTFPSTVSEAISMSILPVFPLVVISEPHPSLHFLTRSMVGAGTFPSSTRASDREATISIAASRAAPIVRRLIALLFLHPPLQLFLGC